MSDNTLKYKLSNYSIFCTVLLAIAISWFFKWNYTEYPLNFMGGDAKDYYSGLVSTFITHDLAHQSGDDWFLLKTESGTINVHSIGVSVLLLPFFGIACLFASLFNFPVDGFSFPFQLSVACAALFYAVIGLIYLKKLFQLHNIGDKTSAIVILLLFFGTNLLNYVLSEAGMSHVYSFSLISVFLYHSSRFVLQSENKHLFFAFVMLGLIVLVRPNNVMVIGSVFIWFHSFAEGRLFFRNLFKNKVFYQSLAVSVLIVLTQSLVWFIQSKSLFHNTYKADGFYWLDPQILKMLFGFDGGFFIYTPLCFLFLLGLVVIFKENKFSFFAAVLFIGGLFYFFASYWAYTYFDGLGIRVLVDYYALFSFIGAKLFTQFAEKTLVYNSLIVIAAFLALTNLVYCYQANRGILLRAGMTYAKWRYVFMKTGAEYRNVLGGSNALTPYTDKEQRAVLSNTLLLDQPFDYSQKDYGMALAFDSIGFRSNRVQVKIDCSRMELETNSSYDALLCLVLEDGTTHRIKIFDSFRLNEAPSKTCCETLDYHYSANVSGDFKPADKFSVLLWNKHMKPFLVNKFAVEVYDYGYHIN